MGNSTSNKEIKRLESALVAVMGQDSNITVQRLAVFINIAKHDPDTCRISDIYPELGISQVGVYKHLQFLTSPKDYGQERALGLVKVNEILDPRPVKILSLTSKGKQLKSSLAALISGK